MAIIAPTYPRIEVPRGALTRARYGLFSVASVTNDADPRIMGGVVSSAENCIDEATGYVGTWCDPTPDAKSVNGLSWSGADPFTVYAGWECTPVGVDGDDATRATARLEAGEQYTVEAAIWDGTNGAKPSLAGTAAYSEGGYLIQPAATVVTGGDMVESVAAVEGALGDNYGGVGVIHASREMVTHMAANNLVTVVEDHLETYLGTQVVAGAGYEPGTIYGTGAIRIWRSPVELLNSFDRAVNTRVVIAERGYVVHFECVLIKTTVTLP